MSIIFRTFGDHSPGLEAQATASSSPVPESQIAVNSLTSTRATLSFSLSGQTINLSYVGTFDVSALGGATPKTVADLQALSIPNSISSFTLGSGGVNFFTESFSPGLTFAQISDLTNKGPAMVALLAGNDAYYAAADATGSNNDSVYLYGGNDTYYVNHALLTKVDLFFGGDGVDTAVFNQKAANFTITSASVWNYVTQKSDLPGFSVTDKTKAINTLYINQVERLQFTDTTIALDTGANQIAGSGYMLYKAAFNRTPDAGGLGYWISRMDAGMSYSDVAKNFVTSTEFKTAFGGSNPSVNTLVTKLYNNVLNRTPDAGGLSFWQDKMTTGGWSTADVLGFFSTSGENVANVTPLIANGIQYQQFVG